MADVDPWDRYKGRKLWLSAYARLTDPYIFSLGDQSSLVYLLTSALRLSAHKGHSADPEETRHILFDNLKLRLSPYVEHETLAEVMSDSPSYAQHRSDASDPVTEAWTEVGLDMRTAAERLRQDLDDDLR